MVKDLAFLVLYFDVLMKRIDLRFRLLERTKELVQRSYVVFLLNYFSEIEVFIKEKLYPVLLFIMAACSSDCKGSNLHLFQLFTEQKFQGSRHL